MFKIMCKLLAIASVIFTTSVHAQSLLQLEVTIPRLQVAEYHKPYIAVWLEDQKRNTTQIAVWYDVEMENGKGEEWLADLRQWWRRGGRKLEMPIDGITGATKGPGSHKITIDLASLLKNQRSGDYKIRVEASREVGGRELLQIPITLPIKSKDLPITVTGKRELDQISLTIKE
ncbi:DUF2271 domain-containing protein [Thalassotalea sp. 1_MG-2023]|uniref:DUF2271 domain-containing protein n=1 Tax=Thalassotalea sp. 1_MG-2023 TaxID=3062680 RepID=UPI0026E32FB0|nr:DUF2271 domain-containing protein [Thalassotalea sp. 1_MG-2023]MDO6428601.1 DUF2271 domain-containing protein [Thalassotalea sp. 1_MG-2023]